MFLRLTHYYIRKDICERQCFNGVFMWFFHKKCVRARGWCGVCGCAGGCVWVGSMAVGVWLKRIPIV